MELHSQDLQKEHIYAHFTDMFLPHPFLFHACLQTEANSALQLMSKRVKKKAF